MRSGKSKTQPVLQPQFGSDLDDVEQRFILSWLAKGSWTMLAALEAKYSADKEDWDLCVSLAECYVHHGRKADALHLLRKAVRTIPNEPEEPWMKPVFPFMNHLQVAEVCWKAGLYKEVIWVCLDVLKKEQNRHDADTGRIAMQLAKAYLALKRYSDLIDLIENGNVGKRGESFFAYWLLAVAYLRTGNTTEAMAAYIFGFNHLAELLDSVLRDSSDSVEQGFLECLLVPDFTREIADVLPVEYGGTSLVVAAYLLGNGKYVEAVKCLKSRFVNTYKRAQPGIANLIAEAEHVAMARQGIVDGKYEVASRLYLKASVFAPSDRQREWRMTAQALKWDLRLYRVLKGDRRATDLIELQRRIKGLKKDFKSIWTAEYGGSRRIIRGRTDESYWWYLKHAWVESLESVLSFKCHWWDTPQWRSAQRTFHEVRLTDFCEAFAAIEQFSARFEQMVVRSGYTSLTAFSEDEQSELLRLLAPGAEVKVFVPEMRAMPSKSLRKLMRAASKIDEIHDVVKGPEKREVLRQLDGNRLLKGGAVWEITYLGKTRPVADRKGMAYIAVLLGNPTKIFTPRSLSLAATGEQPGLIHAGGKREPAENGSKSDQPDRPIALATPETLQSVKAALKVIESKLLEAGSIMDRAKVNEMESQRKDLAKYIAEISTKHGNIRSGLDSYSRQAKAVGKCIVEAIRLIEAGGLPELASHLRASISHPAGRKISYTPSPAVRWEIISRPSQK